MFFTMICCRDSTTEPDEYGTIKGQVVLKDSYPDKPISNSTIIIKSQTHCDSIVSLYGDFIFTKLQKGSYSIVAYAHRVDTFKTEIQVDNGSEYVITIELASTLKHEPGLVAAGFVDSATVEGVYSFISSFNLSCSKLYRFLLQSTLPKDSIPILRKELKSKIYIDSNSVTIIDTDSNYCWIDMVFIGIDGQSIQDWIKTKGQFHIIDYNIIDKYGIIQVEANTESYWIRELKKYNYITFLYLLYNN